MKFEKFKKRRKQRDKGRQSKINVLGILVLTVLFVVFLISFVSIKHKKQVFRSYCGDFGFGGKRLVLMKNKQFVFSYYACSQTNGRISGSWKLNQSQLILDYQANNALLSTEFISKENKLFSTFSKSESFTLCDFFD